MNNFTQTNTKTRIANASFNATDEETYQMLRESKDETFIDAEKWKAKRLEQLSKEGKAWSR